MATGSWLLCLSRGRVHFSSPWPWTGPAAALTNRMGWKQWCCASSGPSFQEDFLPLPCLGTIACGMLLLGPQSPFWRSPVHMERPHVDASVDSPSQTFSPWLAPATVLDMWVILDVPAYLSPQMTSRELKKYPTEFHKPTESWDIKWYYFKLLSFEMVMQQ